ncbi:trypsin iota-like [Prorops nasuta]|uniref:trypsin iota-like n=1 Tax=Prorops nasuta TaxID=863751 RepID=UPI0034CEE347
MFQIFVTIFVALSATMIGSEATNVYRLRIDKTIDIKEAPFVAAIMLNNRYHCNSAIVSPQFILSTAGCILMIKDQLQNVKIRTGTNNLRKGGHTSAVEAYFLNDVTRYDIEETKLYTIGALKLKTPIPFGVTQKPIQIGRLPQDLYESNPPQFITPLLKKWRTPVYGWGQNWRGDENSLGFRKIEGAVILRDAHCQRFVKNAGIGYLNHHICSYVRSGYLGNDSSLLVYDNKLVGLASFFDIEVIDERNRKSYASVLTNVDKVKKFIIDLIGEQNFA